MIDRLHYDRDQLVQFLQGRGETQVLEMGSHLENCPQCQAELESIVESDFDWEETCTLLRGSHITDSPVDEKESTQSPFPTSLLVPSEHPGSLGKFGRYEVMELIGRGGMGIVFRAFDPELNRYSALKVLAPELAGSAAARRRFFREARSAAAVVHPHVVPIQTVDEQDGLPYLLMPVIEGQSLQQRVDSIGPLPVLEVVRIAAQIAEGLAAAHAQGLVHRDIKPANILLENGVERVQITDFGLARAIDDASMTRSGVIAGTPQYMSPEQAHGDEIDPRSDLFSLGSVMYFMLTGRSPFRAETTMGVLNRIGNDVPRSLRSINPDVSPWLEELINRLLAKDPNQRFQSAEEVAVLLSSWQAHLQRPNIIAPPQTASGSGSGNGRVAKWLGALGLGGVFVWLVAIVILETGKGTIRIESNQAAAVPIRIMKGNQVVDQLTVSQNGARTRLLAGEYVVEVDGDATNYVLEGNEITLKRGEDWIVKIQEKPSLKNEVAQTSTQEMIVFMERSDLYGHDHDQERAVEEDDRQYLIWEFRDQGNIKSDVVRLSHWFAKSVGLDVGEKEKIAQLLTEYWQKYLKLESSMLTYSYNNEGHLIAEVGWGEAFEPGDHLKIGKRKNQFLQTREKLDNEFWTKLDSIVSGRKRALLHAISTVRGNAVGDDSWPDRPKAYPSLLGYEIDFYPIKVEIWTKGTWFHWRLSTRQGSVKGDAQSLPPELMHYYYEGQKYLEEHGNFASLRTEIKRNMGVLHQLKNGVSPNFSIPWKDEWNDVATFLVHCEGSETVAVNSVYANADTAIILTEPLGQNVLALLFESQLSGDWSLTHLAVIKLEEVDSERKAFLKQHSDARKIPVESPGQRSFNEAGDQVSESPNPFTTGSPITDPFAATNPTPVLPHAKPNIHKALAVKIQQVIFKLRVQTIPEQDPFSPSLGNWKNEVDRLYKCEGFNDLDVDQLYADSHRAVAFTTTVEEEAGRHVLALLVFEYKADGKWELTMIDLEPADRMKRDLENFLEESPDAKRIPFKSLFKASSANDPFAFKSPQTSGSKAPNANPFSTGPTTQEGNPPSSSSDPLFAPVIQMAYETRNSMLDLDTGKTEGPRASISDANFVDPMDLKSQIGAAESSYLIRGNLKRSLKLDEAAWQEGNGSLLDSYLPKLQAKRPASGEVTLAETGQIPQATWIAETNEGTIAIIKLGFNPKIQSEFAGIKSGFDVQYRLLYRKKRRSEVSREVLP